MISKFSVKKPYTVLVGVVLILVLGFVSLTRMTTDLLPDMNLPYVLIMTTDNGASPEEVETSVSAPIEAAMATTSNIKNVSSTSYNNYSVVILEYEQSANMDSTLIEIQQKLDQIKGNWKDTVGSPMIMQLDPDMMPIMTVAVDVEGMEQGEITDYVKDQLAPAIESVDGVANVTSTGTLEQEIQVTMDQKKIDALNEKIQKKIDAQFKDAQKKLDSSSAEIKKGQSQLSDGEKQLADQVGSSQKDIINKKIELAKNEEELAAQLITLNENKTAISNAIKSLQSAYDGAVKLQEAIDSLKKAKKTITSTSPVMAAPMFEALSKNLGQKISSVDDIDKSIEKLEAQLDQINQSLAAQMQHLKIVELV